MSLTIRKRCGKVAECLKKKGVITIKTIASATGLFEEKRQILPQSIDIISKPKGFLEALPCGHFA